MKIGKLHMGTLEIPERIERCEIFLKVRGNCLNESDLERLKKCRLFAKPMEDDGTLALTYDFGVEYYRVVAEFSLILDLLDKAYVSKVDTKELQLGKCLIQELLCKLEQLENKFARK